MMVEELEALYREQLPGFTRAAIAIAGDEEAGRDAVQEAFAKALRRHRRFRGDGSLEAWVWQIVVNAARDARRRGRRKAEVALPVEARASELGLPLELLTERQREVLFLHYYADLDYSTIAHALDISPGTVGATLSAARQTLRGALTKEVSR
jgi:RNA polymerase sigma-70 factor (ECF subfamily)